MTVRELREMLEECNDDAQVVVEVSDKHQKVAGDVATFAWKPKHNKATIGVRLDVSGEETRCISYQEQLR